MGIRNSEYKVPWGCASVLGVSGGIKVRKLPIYSTNDPYIGSVAFPTWCSSSWILSLVLSIRIYNIGPSQRRDPVPQEQEVDRVVPAKRPEPRCGIVIRCESVNQTSGGKKRRKFLQVLTFHWHEVYTFKLSDLAHAPVTHLAGAVCPGGPVERSRALDKISAIPHARDLGLQTLRSCH